MTFFACWLLTKKCHHTTKNAFCLPFACCNLQWHEPPKELMMIILMNQTMGSIDMKNSKMTIIFLLFEDHDYRPWRILHTSSRIIFFCHSPLLIGRENPWLREALLLFTITKNSKRILHGSAISTTSGLVVKNIFPYIFNTIASVLSF